MKGINMAIYTRKGDDGNTHNPLAGRVSKNSSLIHLSGSFDEALSAIGFAIANTDDESLANDEIRWIVDCLRWTQHRLFTCAGTITADAESNSMISSDDIESLESMVDIASEITPPLKSFILPGGSELAARLHLARTAVRRCERAIVAVAENGFPIHDEGLAFVNRLADVLFAFARYANFIYGVDEISYSVTPDKPNPMR